MTSLKRSLTLLCALLAFSCALEAATITKNINAGKNMPFKLELAGNPTTGYNWELDRINKTDFTVLKSGFTPPQSKLVGAGGVNWWLIKPLRGGTKIISLLYYRPWEGKSKAVEQCVVTVKVK